MKLKVIGHNGDNFSSAPLNNPWNAFFKELERNDINLVGHDEGIKYDALIANTHSKKAIRECEKFGISKNRRILILWEPKEINGKLYKPSTLDNYGHIFTPSSDWTQGSKTHEFKWPQGKAVKRTETDKEWLKRKHKFVFIGSNKYSVSKGEFYSLRRSILRDPHNSNYIDLFGHSWNSNLVHDIKSILSSLTKVNINQFSLKSLSLFAYKYTNYQGISRDKIETLKNYKFAVVIENSSNYVSEKLFEALEGQCIVLYVGANLRKFLTTDIAIQSEANTASISKKIEKMIQLSKSEQLTIRKKQRREYLAVNKQWENYKVLKKLASDSIKLLNF